MIIISTTVGKNPREEMEKPSQSTRVRHAVQGCKLKNKRMILVHFQGKPFNITVIQVYAATTNAERAKVEWSYEDLQDLRELIPQKKKPQKTEDALFIIWNAKAGCQEIPRETRQVWPWSTK